MSSRMLITLKTQSGKTVTMEVNSLDSFENVKARIQDEEKIAPDKLIFTVEEQEEENKMIDSTPDMFGSEELFDKVTHYGLPVQHKPRKKKRL